jgi:salicylate hydroxylase
MTKRALKITVVGAGLGGLVAAIAARRSNFEVQVFEQTRVFRDIGAGIQMGPNAVKTLRALELEDGLVRFGAMPRNHIGRNWRSGRTLFRSATHSACVERFGVPFYQVQRSDLHTHLRNALPDACIQVDRRFESMRQDKDVVVARFSDGTEVESDVLIGADGIHSAVKTSLVGPDSPRFTGVICWRGQALANQLPKGLIPPDSLNWMGPGGCVVHYYVRPGELVNWIAHRTTDVWAEEAWSVPGDKQELMQAFEGWHPSLLQLFEATEECFKWAIFDRDPLPFWSKERTTLLGDAAHPMLPFLAQGGAMAMEDGLVLTQALRQHDDDVPFALRRYEAVRKERATKVQMGSRARASICQVSSPFQQFRRDAAYLLHQLLRPGSAIQKADWIYGYDASRVEV